MKRYLNNLLLITLLFAFPTIMSGQGAARLGGKITDAVTGDPLIGASVAIQGTSFGDATDLEGNFIIYNISPGTYTLQVRYLGYEAVDESGVELGAGQIKELNVALNPTAIQGEEVVVTIQARGQMAAINQERSADGVKNIVSSDKIQEVPDLNAAESIGRLPGVSLQRSGGEGNKIVVRGLSPKYATIMVDGVRLQGADLDRSAGLNSISSDMLGGIELTKTLSADQEADAIAGTVNLRTRTAAEGLHFDLSALNGYNSLEKTLANYKFNGFISNRFFDNKFGVFLSGSHEELTPSSDRYTGSISVDESYIDPQNPGVTDTVLLANNTQVIQSLTRRTRNNGGLVLDFKNDFMTLKLNNFYTQLINNNEVRTNSFYHTRVINAHEMNASRSFSDQRIQSHALSGDFKIGSSNLNAGISYSKTSRYSDGRGYQFKDRDAFVEGRQSIDKDQRVNLEPDGDFVNTYYDVKTGLSAGLWNSTRDTTWRDDDTRVAFLDWSVPFNIGKTVSGYVKFGGRYSKKSRSANSENKKYDTGQGGYSLQRTTYVYNNYPDLLKPEDVPEFTTTVAIPAANFIDADYVYGDVLNGTFDLSWSPDIDKLDDIMGSMFGIQPGLVVRDGKASFQNDYENSEEYMAGYVMTKLNIGPRLTIIPGVRYERMQTEYHSFYMVTDGIEPSGLKIGYPTPISVTDRMNAELFPSVSVKADLLSWVTLRAGYYKSTSRPNYSRLSPVMIVDDQYETMTARNPYLRPSTAHNLDLGFSFFAPRMGLFTINGFYKELTDLEFGMGYNTVYIDNAQDFPEGITEGMQRARDNYPEELFLASAPGTNVSGYTINNPNKALYGGLEFSWQTNFFYLPGVLRGLVLDLNYSIMWSQTDYPFMTLKDSLVDTGGLIPQLIKIPLYNTSSERMIDQAKHLFNARIGWDYRGFSTRVSFRLQDNAFRGYNLRLASNTITDTYFRIDLNMKQQITERLSLFFNGTNLTNESEVFVRTLEDLRLPTSRQNYGMTLQLGARYAF